MQAIEAEVEAFLAGHAALVDEQGRQRLVRSGHGPERQRQLRRGVHRSLASLHDAITAFIDRHNADPKPLPLDQIRRRHPCRHRALLPSRHTSQS